MDKTRDKVVNNRDKADKNHDRVKNNRDRCNGTVVTGIGCTINDRGI